jgi:hypothetical protein
MMAVVNIMMNAVCVVVMVLLMVHVTVMVM